MSRREQIIITLLAVVVFTAPIVLLALGVRPSFDENRERTAAPTFTARSAVKGETWSQLGDYITDRFPLRDRAIDLNADLRSQLNVAEAVEEDVPRGADGWLYHDATLYEDCLGPPPATFFASGDEIPPRADRADTPFLFVVIPDKVVVYPDHQVAPGLTGPLGLADATEMPGCATTWVDALGASASTRDWLWDLRPDLIDQRDEHPLYYQQDTHWTDAGASLFVQGLIDRIAPGAFDPADVRANGREVSRSDLAHLKGRTFEEPQPQLEVVRPGVTIVESVQPSDEKAATKIAWSSAVTTDAPLVEGTTVVLGDSFTGISFRLLSPYFEKLVFLQIPYLKTHTIGEALDGETADRIIVVEVQRNVAKGWYEAFTEATNHHLVHEQTGS